MSISANTVCVELTLAFAPSGIAMSIEHCLLHTFNSWSVKSLLNMSSSPCLLARDTNLLAHTGVPTGSSSRNRMCSPCPSLIICSAVFNRSAVVALPAWYSLSLTCMLLRAVVTMMHTCCFMASWVKAPGCTACGTMRTLVLVLHSLLNPQQITVQQQHPPRHAFSPTW